MLEAQLGIVYSVAISESARTIVVESRNKMTILCKRIRSPTPGRWQVDDREKTSFEACGMPIGLQLKTSNFDIFICAAAIHVVLTLPAGQVCGAEVRYIQPMRSQGLLY